MTNIFRCTSCKRMLMAEELGGHVCKVVIDYKIEGDTLHVSDGELWYPLKLPTKKQQPERTPDKGNTTEKFVSLIAIAAYNS